MPIPIPIPVPAGPPQGSAKFAHQQRHNNQADEEEGEVKKIYLLQPMQKLHPQPQLKGGGFMGGPVQTHIHMPAPQVIAQQQHQHQRQRHRAAATKQQQSFESDERPQSSTKHQQHSELKILPIVVIPPIAPMPPIQLPPTTSHSQAPRMTLTPQFNNYVVAAASDRGHKRAHRIPSGGPLQDHKSFSDYNFAATSGSNYRGDQQRQRPRMRSRQRERPQRNQADNSYSASRLARIRQMIDEDALDDYEHNVRYTGQSSRVVPRYVSGGSASNSRRRPQLEPDFGASRPRAGSAQSNRDQMLDQQSALFDDEPSSMAESAPDGHTDSRDQHRRLRQFSDNSETSSDLASNQVQDRDYDDPNNPNADRAFSDGSDERTRQSPSSGQSHQLQFDNGAQDPNAIASDYQRSQNRGDLSTVYYERDGARDYQSNEAAAAPRDRRIHYPGGEREIFEDDEWRFDTIKSVAHLDPKSKGPSSSTDPNGVHVNQTNNRDSPEPPTTKAPPTTNTTVTSTDD